jgi:hypothetical protein
MPVVSLTAKFQQVNLANWTMRLILITAVALGAVHAWAAATSYSMNEDGISYLDIGDAYWRGDWEGALNPVWSPLYPWILGGVNRIFQPGIHWEFPLVHAVNFTIYLFALVSFAYFWKQVGDYRRFLLVQEHTRAKISFPEWAFNALGYLLFIWTSLTLIEIWAVTPDMLMAGIVYLAGAILVRMRMQAQNLRISALLGFTLGIGYLVKTIMLPVSFLFLGALLFLGSSARKSFTRFLVALLVFILIASPYIALISLAKGRFTYGESGTITYLRHVNQVTFPHWQGGSGDYGVPVHPSRQVFEKPAIYEFGSPIGGTYPISYDPSYWYEGVRPNYSLQAISSSIISSLLVYYGLLFQQLGLFLSGIAILYLMALDRKRSSFPVLEKWSLAIISTFVLVLYSLVYVEGRYIAVFVVLLIADLFVNLALPDQPVFRRLIAAASFLMIFSLLGNLAASNLEGYSRLSARGEQIVSAQRNASSPSWPGEIAQELQFLEFNREIGWPLLAMLIRLFGPG